MRPDYVVVFDTYATSGFRPSTKVTYGLADWPSYSHWIVYYEGLDC
jgi:hypothetical protein